MGLEIVDLVLEILCLHLVTFGAGVVKGAEQAAEFAGVGLLQECVELLDQHRHGCFLVHGLIGQGAELAAESGDHPAGEVEIFPLRGAEMLLDRDHLLLADEAVPGTQRLGVVGGVGVVGGHVLAHDFRGVFRDVEAGVETVLESHAGDGLGFDVVPGRAVLLDEFVGGGDFVLVGQGGKSFRLGSL